MPGVIIRGGPSINPNIVIFQKPGVWEDAYLFNNGIFSNLVPFVIMNSGSIRRITARCSQNVSGAVIVTLRKNGASLVSLIIDPGTNYKSLTANLGDYLVALDDELSCDISGGQVMNLTVQVNLI